MITGQHLNGYHFFRLPKKGGELSRIVAQSAKKGSWPEVMCATEEGLKGSTCTRMWPAGVPVKPAGRRDHLNRSADRRDLVDTLHKCLRIAT